MYSTDETVFAPISPCVVALDQTEYWNIKPEHKEHIKAIRTVYFYNKNEVTHCCEITPSYCLYFLYHEVILTDKAVMDVSEQYQSIIYDTYENEPTDERVTYAHCRDIDALEDKGVHYQSTNGCLNFSYDDVSYDDQIESYIEHYRCNHVI